jgi:hypothetical protein
MKIAALTVSVPLWMIAAALNESLVARACCALAGITDLIYAIWLQNRTKETKQ